MIRIDLSALISTIVTATSALVAIIGGFLVSRVLTISSEQNGIQRRIKEINNNIRLKEEILERIKQDLLDEDADDFIEENYIDLIFNDISCEDLMEKEGFRGRNAEEFKSYIEELYGIREDLFYLLDKEQDFIEDFDDFYEKYKFKFPHRKSWYELIYDKMIEDVRKQQRSGPFSYMPSYSISSSTTTLINATRSQAIVDAYNQKRKECNDLQNGIKALNLHKEEQLKILQDYGKPKGMWMGLAVLFYACIVGIAYPSTLLPYPEGVYNDILTRRLILGLFYSQLFFLFIYLAYYMHILTKEDK